MCCLSAVTYGIHGTEVMELPDVPMESLITVM